MSYVRYDFCRFNPSNGAVDACEASLRIARPADPAPAPTAAPAPQDADGDGVPVPADCWDQNATVFPGAPEIPGNTIDDDCAGGDAPARLTATIRYTWTKGGGRLWLDRLRVIEAPPGARVEIVCRGARCPFKYRFATVDRDGNATLKKFFKHKLRPKLTIEVRVTYPNTIGRVGRFRLNRVAIPEMQRLCLPPGTTKPQHC